MIKKAIVFLLVLVMSTSLITGCTQKNDMGVENGNSEVANGDENEWPELYFQLANSNPAVETNQMHKACELFCKKVAEKTGGRVIVEEIPDAQLGNERDFLEGVKLGTIDLCLISNSMMTNYNPANIFGELPFIYNDAEMAFKYLDSDLWRDMLTEKITPELDIVSLGWYSGGFRNILNTKRAINAPEDLIGLKIRGQENRVVVAMYQALGANCTPMPVSEVVAAVQQGTVDGCDFPIGTMISYGYPQFVKHLALTNHLFYSFSICSSKRVWDKLTPEVQEVFKEAAREAELEQRQWVKDLEADQLDSVLKTMEATNVDREAFIKKMEPVYEMFRSEVGEEFFEESMKLLGKK